MDEDPRVRAALQHIGRGGDLAHFSATLSEKRALIAAAGRRGLILWDKARGRYELTSRGRRVWRHRPRSRASFSAQAIVITVAAVAFGLWLSAGVSGLLVARQIRPVALASMMPVQTVTAMDAWSQPAPAGETNNTAEQRQDAEESSMELATATIGPPKPVVPEVTPVRQDEPRRAAHAKRKVSKTHRKRLHASRRWRNHWAVTYHYPRQFRRPRYSSFANQSTWSSFRINGHRDRLMP
jgi:hypothetical protein